MNLTFSQAPDPMRVKELARSPIVSTQTMVPRQIQFSLQRKHMTSMFSASFFSGSNSDSLRVHLGVLKTKTHCFLSN